MRRNLELENWLIETIGEEMMANHLGPNWNRFNDEIGFYPNMSMTIADQVWQHQQTKVDELQNRLDVVKQLIEEYRDPPTEDKTFQHALSIVADELEQALKAGEG